MGNPWSKINTLHKSLYLSNLHNFWGANTPDERFLKKTLYICAWVAEYTEVEACEKRVEKKVKKSEKNR